ncbi:phosphotransferase [Streptomyces sp. 4N509B]|uniref:phosphotransferase n=1 Tax=Streptomyces sp. 4N509B TaxID=3457413 RepID=UPI003FCEED06
MEIGGLLGSGRTADVYALDERRVLRRYREGTDATAEAALMAHVAGHGYPVPAVFPATPDPASGPSPGPAADPAAATGAAAASPDLVLERLTGPTMAAAVLAGDLTAEAAGATLARLLASLHQIPPPRADDPAARVLHLDLHPENVLMTPRGPVVIDWANATQGPPGRDRAVSALILAEVAVGPADAVARGASGILRALLTHLPTHLSTADAGAPFDAADLAWARAVRAANPTLDTTEKGRLDRAVALAGELLGRLSPAADSTGPWNR